MYLFEFSRKQATNSHYHSGNHHYKNGNKTGVIALAYVCSLVGFGDLVGTVYPIFGYLSILLLIAMVWRACVYFKKERKSL